MSRFVLYANDFFLQWSPKIENLLINREKLRGHLVAMVPPSEIDSDLALTIRDETDKILYTATTASPRIKWIPTKEEINEPKVQ